MQTSLPAQPLLPFKLYPRFNRATCVLTLQAQAPSGCRWWFHQDHTDATPQELDAWFDRRGYLKHGAEPV